LSASAETAQSITIWDPVVRLTHWGLVLAVLTNTFIADIGSRTHRWAGYLTGVLVVVRLVWGFIGSKHARLADFIPILRQVRRHLDAFATETPSVHDGHNPLGALMVFALLGLLALLCLTGLLG
jgi:cytochrome b